MQIFVQFGNGSKPAFEVEGTDSVESLRTKIHEQWEAAHPGLQRLVLAEGNRVLEDGHTLAEYGLHKESELRLGVVPPTEAIVLSVGGVEYITTLDTLLSVSGSQLHSMFADVPQGGVPCFPTPLREVPVSAAKPAGGAGGGIAESVPPPRRPRGPLPKVGGAYILDRDGPSFRFVLNYLRRETIVLPTTRGEVEELKHEAQYFGLPELEAACDRRLRGVGSLSALAAACEGGVTVADIVALSSDELEELMQQQKVNVVVAKRIRQEAQEEREQAKALARVGAALSDAGLRSLVCAGLKLDEICALSAAQARELGLSVEDARLVDALRVEQVVVKKLETVWSPEHKGPSIELTAPLVAKNNSGGGEGVYSVGLLPRVGQHYFEVTFHYPGGSKGSSLGNAYLVGVARADVGPGQTRMYERRGHWGLEDNGKIYEDASPRSVEGASRNARGSLYGSGERVGVLADMDARPRTLRFFREGALLDGVVCSGFPEQVRICASPYNRGVTATLSFPARPE